MKLKKLMKKNSITTPFSALMEMLCAANINIHELKFTLINSNHEKALKSRYEFSKYIIILFRYSYFLI